MLNGLQPGNEGPCAEGGIIPVLNSLEQWRAWRATAKRLRRTLPAVLQFDTGMSRLGVSPEELGTLAVERMRRPRPIGFFSCSDLRLIYGLSNELTEEYLTSSL